MLAGIPVHAIQRGNNRQPCFYEEEDRDFYLFHLRRLLRKTGCTLHAFCLMTNHVHLLLTADSPVGCGRLMKDVGQLHTQYVNRKYGRTGSLWEGRYRSCLVQAEDYVLACYRYVEMNPVRANLVAHARDDSWSSYGFNADGITNALITPHDEYLRLGASSGERRSAYQQLIHEVLDSDELDEIRTATNGNFALGGKAFRQRMSAALGRRTERGSAGRPRLAVPADQLDLLDLPKKNVVCP